MLLEPPCLCSLIYFVLYNRVLLHVVSYFIKLFQVLEAVLCSILELSDPKHLDFTTLLSEDCFRPCATFLKACPSLHKLTLKVDVFICGWFQILNICCLYYLVMLTKFQYLVCIPPIVLWFPHNHSDEYLRKHPHSSLRVVKLRWQQKFPRWEFVLIFR